MTSVQGYAVRSGKGKLEPFSFRLGPLAPGDVEVKVTHCGICHSDLSMIDNEWGMSVYPLVAGHEIVGTVTAVAPDVRGIEVGQRVGIGWQSGSCGTCPSCNRGKEHVCPLQAATIVGRYGGFAEVVRVAAKFAVPIPETISSQHAAPLMCAGTTVYTPMLHHKVTAGMSAAVIGIGGLGHLAIQFLSKLGCEVTAISTTHSKEPEAKAMGAHKFLATNDAGALKGAANSFDFVMSTVPADLPWNEIVSTLRPEGTLSLVGVPDSDMPIGGMGLIAFERTIAGGRAGAPADTRQMFEFCARTGVKPIVELFPLAKINEAIDHVRSGKVRYRAVLVS